MTDKPPLNNIIEESLRDVPQQNVMDSNALLVAMLGEVQKEKIELARAFISREDLKTQVNSWQRDLIPVMAMIGIKPFESTERFLLKHGKPKKEIEKIMQDQQIEFLKVYVPHWMELGLALDRKGRDEDKYVLSALVNTDTEVRTNGQQTQNKI